MMLLNTLDTQNMVVGCLKKTQSHTTRQSKYIAGKVKKFGFLNFRNLISSATRVPKPWFWERTWASNSCKFFSDDLQPCSGHLKHSTTSYLYTGEKIRARGRTNPKISMKTSPDRKKKLVFCHFPLYHCSFEIPGLIDHWLYHQLWFESWEDRPEES